MSSPKIDAKEKPECLEFAFGEYCHVLNVEKESYPVHLALVNPNGPGTDPLSSEFPNNCPSKTDPTPV